MLRSLPGVAFEVKTAPAPDRLPRMDVAAFVGFASAGPLDTPVPVEDEVRFREIFGQDLDLAWDPREGAMHRSFLGPAVRLFFRNGGRRCWVVRVTLDRPEYTRFMVPGLIDGATGVTAMVRARSEGTWADSLRVGVSLNRMPLGQVGVAPGGPETPLLLTVPRRTGESLQPGDLLRVAFGPGAPVLYLAVTHVKESAQRSAADLPQWEVRGREFWYRPYRGDGTTRSVQILRPVESEEIGEVFDGYYLAAPSHHNDELHRLWVPAEKAPQVGTVLKVPQENVWLTVTRVLLPWLGEMQSIDSKLVDDAWRVLLCQPALRRIPEAEGRAAVTAGAGSGGAVASAERLTFHLRTANEDGKTADLRDLGFVAGHPRFLGYLPTDQDLFMAQEERGPLPDGPLPGAGLWRDAAHPRFALAADRTGDVWPEVYLPLGMEYLSQSDFPVQAEPSQLSAPVRNGLSELDVSKLADLFLDPDLADARAGALEAQIFHQRDVLRRRLRKLHALWPLDEVTLFAVPDLAHPAWRKVEEESGLVLNPPELLRPEAASGELISLAWRAEDGVDDYVLEEAADPDFASPLHHVVQGKAHLDLAPSGRFPRYFRVKVQRWDGGAAPWSRTWCITGRRRGERGGIDLVAREAPVLTLELKHGRETTYFLKWSADSHQGDAGYVLQSADGPDFDNSREVYTGRSTGPLAVTLPTNGKLAYYRVRANGGPWSATVVLAHWIVEKKREVIWPAESENLLPDMASRIRVQRAMLRLGQGRGDMFAVLTLPPFYQQTDVATYVQYLQAEVANGQLPQGDVGGDKGALGFGAIYHPWVWFREERGEYRLIPPDGPILGTMAARAAERGAWVAPANMPLKWVHAVQPALARSDAATLTQEQVNVVLPEPRGFLVLSANTLSAESDLRPINVRRLLSLLRRVAMREGISLVFEPNTDALRRRVQVRFERLLSEMFKLGAFAGKTQAEAFQVVAGSVINPRESVEAGRLMVELRVAPSLPLAFVTVRLLQGHGARPIVTEE